LDSAMRGSLRNSALGPPSQIPSGPASRVPRSGLLRLRALAPAHLSWSRALIRHMQSNTWNLDMCHSIHDQNLQ
ncbi:Multidrug/Oligosaccharidyl-lipid/Polysaccharide (MOP) Flippase transporter, partial [Phytophthora megakarya]